MYSASYLLPVMPLRYRGHLALGKFDRTTQVAQTQRQESPIVIYIYCTIRIYFRLYT